MGSIELIIIKLSESTFFQKLNSFFSFSRQVSFLQIDVSKVTLPKTNSSHLKIRRFSKKGMYTFQKPPFFSGANLLSVLGMVLGMVYFLPSNHRSQPSQPSRHLQFQVEGTFHVHLRRTFHHFQVKLGHLKSVGMLLKLDSSEWPLNVGGFFK